MNVGFREAMREEDWDCLFFHDVDLIPEDDRNTYVCDSNPKHAAIAMDKFGYKYVLSCLSVFTESFALHSDTQSKNLFFIYIFISLQTSIQDVLWRSVSSDAITLPKNERLSQQLLGLGWRGWWYWSQVRIFEAKRDSSMEIMCLWSVRHYHFEFLSSAQMKYNQKNKTDNCFLPSQSVFGRDVHHATVTEGRPLQDDKTQAGQRQWCEPKEVQSTSCSEFNLMTLKICFVLISTWTGR